MAIKIAVTNHKGGVGKTTTVLNLAAAILQHYPSKKILLIDLDSQTNLSLMQSPQHYKETNTIYHAMMGINKVFPVPIKENIHLLPSTIEMMDSEIGKLVGHDFILKELIEDYNFDKQYDFIIMDTPPSLANLTMNALTASDYVVIPTEPELYSFVGLKRIFEVINLVNKRLNPNLNIGGILITKVDGRTSLHAKMISSIDNIFNEYRLENYITRSIKMSISTAFKDDIFTYDKKSVVANNYLDATKELLNKIKYKG